MKIQHAFTLVELLVVIAILSFLSALTMLQSIGAYQSTIKAVREIEQLILQKAQEGKIYRHIRDEGIRGISTVEILVALTVMTLAITASATVGIGVPNIIADAKNASVALEKARIALLDGLLISEPLEDENFLRKISHQEWTTSRSVVHTIELSTITKSDDESEACDPFTSGDWSHPVLARSYAVDESLGLPAAVYSISSLSISPGMLAIGIGSTSEAAKPTLLLFQLIGTSSSRLLGAFDNASTSRIGNNAVASEGQYVFSGNAFSSASSATCNAGASCAQVNVYAKSGLISSLVLATTTVPFASRADGTNAPVSILTYYRGFLYVGLQKTVRGDEFNIIDARDPTHLRWVSGYPVGRTVNSITIRDSLAYIGTDDPSRELMIFDVRNPAQPALYSVWDAPGSSTFGYGSASTVFGDSVRFGRTYSASDPEFELLRVKGASTTEIARLDSGTSKDPESVRALLTQDRLTFMLLTHRLDVLDTHDHITVKLIGSYSLPPGSQATALACRNNQLYLGRTEGDGSGHLDILQGS